MTEEQRRNVSVGTRLAVSKFNFRAYERTLEIRENIRIGLKNFYENKRLKSSFDQLGRKRRRDKVLLEQNNLCNICKKLFEWNNLPLIPEYHHKDGNRKNEFRENVEFLCPNCHSQTDNDRFRGRKHSKYTKDLLSIKMRKIK